MNDASRGGVIVAVIVLALAAYLAIWTPGCTGGENGGNGDTNGGPSTGGRTIMAEGEIAPDFTATSLDGREIKLSDFIGQKPVVLDFWATWCGPCKMELPLLQAFYATNSDRVEILAITKEPANKAGDIRAVVDEKGLTFPILHDPTSGIANMYPTRGIPYLVFIDIDGKVVKTHLGMDPNLGETILTTFGLSDGDEPPGTEEPPVEDETSETSGVEEEVTGEALTESGE